SRSRPMPDSMTAACPDPCGQDGRRSPAWLSVRNELIVIVPRGSETAMAAIETRTLANLVSDKEDEILPEWLELLKKAAGLQTGRISESELAAQCRDFLHLLRDALERCGLDASNAGYSQVRDFLGNMSRSRALQGFSPPRPRPSSSR